MAREVFVPGLGVIKDDANAEVFFPGLGVYSLTGSPFPQAYCDAVLLGTDSVSASVDAVLKLAPITVSSSVDAVLAGPTQVVKQASADAVLVGSGQILTSVDAKLRKQVLRTASADAVLGGPPVTSAHTAPVVLSLTSAHTAPLAFRLYSAHTGSYSLLARLVSGHTAPYADATPVTGAHTATWGLLADVVGAHTAPYALLAANPIVSGHKAVYNLSGFPSQQQSVAYSVTVGGSDVQALAISVAQDEGGFWTCQVELAEPSDYGRFAYDSTFSLTIGATVWAMLTDRKTRSRTAPEQSTWVIHGIGISALYDEPRADPVTKTWESPILASAVCTELLGSCTWGMVDWQIPAYRLAADGASPIAVARRVIEAAGGILDYAPDGSFTARAEFPVSVPGFSTASPDHTLSESDNIYTLDETLSPDKLINWLRIYDTDGAGYGDRIEFEADEDNGLTGTLRVYPSPWRTSIQVTTTAGAYVSLTALGTTTRTVSDERIEFKEGVGSTQYPIQSLSSVTWITDDLGSLVHDAYGSVLTAGSADYGLAIVSYVTKSIDYTATASQATPAQMLVVDTAV